MARSADRIVSGPGAYQRDVGVVAVGEEVPKVPQQQRSQLNPEPVGRRRRQPLQVLLGAVGLDIGLLEVRSLQLQLEPGRRRELRWNGRYLVFGAPEHIARNSMRR